MKKITTLCLSLIIALAGMAEEWEAIQSASELSAGDQIVLAYPDGKVTASTTLTTTSNNGYLGEVSATFSGTTLTAVASTTAIFTLSGNSSAWTLTSQDGKVLGATAAKKLAWDSGTKTWTITATAVKSTNSSFGTIQYNSTSPRFCNYTTTQKAIQVYRKKSAPVVTYSISYQGFPYRKTACEEPTYEAGSTYTLPTFVPVNEEGKSLKEWSYGDATYAPGATFTIPESDVVFVPVWNGAEAIDNAAEAIRATKILRNGQLIIVRGEAEYNAIGTRVK